MNMHVLRFCCRSMTVVSAVVLSLCSVKGVCADCTEFKIVEYEDRVEAVCVGEPVSEAQQKAQASADLEEQKRLDREAHKKSVEERDRQREEARGGKARADAEAEGERKRRSSIPAPTQPAKDPNQLKMMRF